ncbi:MAG TPA: ATP-binding protein [Acidimicrobiia bacterium]|jgi:signal transduction histidine kinase|nr:ATP-binding protein [Acidimicrobiia bacterium]
MRTADPVAELEQIEREYAAVIALLDRSAALRHAAALVPPEVSLDVGFAAERIDDLDTLSVCAVSGNRTDALQELVIPAGMGLSGKVASLRHPIAVADYLREPGITHDFDPQWRAEGLRAAVAVPISRGHWFYGVLCGAAREPGEIPVRTIDAMMRLARQTGLAIEVADHAREMADVAVHEERRHLALTIHDSVGAILFSIGAATRDLDTERECEPELRARLKYIEQQVAKASAQLRQALRSLNEVPQEVALGVSLRAECRALEERTGMKAGCVVLGDLPALEEGRAKVLLQAAREALHNAEKHARARSVVVSLHAVDGGVSLVVADDGVGLSPPKAEGPAGEDGLVTEEGQASTGLGLEATADRLGRVGGQLVVSTNEDGGCTMRAWMPC